MLLALPIFITSCSDDESGINSMIIGSWYQESSPGYKMVTTYYDNGTYVMTVHTSHGSYTCEQGLYRLEQVEPDGTAEHGVIYIHPGTDGWDDDQVITGKNYQIIENYSLYIEGAYWGGGFRY